MSYGMGREAKEAARMSETADHPHQLWLGGLPTRAQGPQGFTGILPTCRNPPFCIPLPPLHILRPSATPAPPPPSASLSPIPHTSFAHTPTLRHTVQSVHHPLHIPAPAVLGVHCPAPSRTGRAECAHVQPPPHPTPHALVKWVLSRSRTASPSPAHPPPPTPCALYSYP